MRRRKKLNIKDLPPHLAAMVPPKRHKYDARAVEVDGVKYPSKAEYSFIYSLQIRERAGEISDLKIKTRYPIFINGIKVCDVEDDASYTENGKRIAVDVKGMLLPISRLKHKMVAAAYPDLEWRIIKRRR